MMNNKSKNVNTYLLTTVTTLVVILVMGAIKYLAGNEINLADLLTSAVIFWIFYFLSFRFFTKMIGKRRK